MSHSADPYAHLKDGSWREIAEIDARLERGVIDERSWHAEMAALVVPAYLAAATPWGQSGKSGTLDDWRYSRELVVEALDRPGSFLDVGCANGFLLECVVDWSPHAIEPYGLEIAPELAALARRRLPAWRERIAVGNALEWEPPQRFTYVRTNLDVAPPPRWQELVSRFHGWCDRLLLGVYNEQRDSRPTELLLQAWGFEIAGRSERPHRMHPDIDYRLVWIDA